MGRGTLHIIVYRWCMKVHAKCRSKLQFGHKVKGGTNAASKEKVSMVWSLKKWFRSSDLMAWKIIYLHVYTVFRLHSFIKNIQITKVFWKSLSLFYIHVYLLVYYECYQGFCFYINNGPFFLLTEVDLFQWMKKRVQMCQTFTPLATSVRASRSWPRWLYRLGDCWPTDCTDSERKGYVAIFSSTYW